ncbi:MAG: DsrE family protein [Spirochaetes bacterium]|nr:DsrE family protein [Spirochaetota bacterium]
MDKLYILWTTADEVMFDKMIAMYARTGIAQNWWYEITIIIWGSTARLAAESELISLKIKELLHVGVKVSACKACSDSIGVSEKLIEMGIEVKYWGEGLTEILKSNQKMLTL